MTMVKHARRNAREREITEQEIQIVVNIGKRIPTYLGRQLAMWGGVIAVIDAIEQVIITAYRGTPYQLAEFI